MKTAAGLSFAFAVLLAGLPGHAGTWTSTGGGSGIMCYQTEEAANEYRQGADLAARPDLVAQLKTMMTTDIWENYQNGFVQPGAGESPESYIRRILKIRLETSAPGFYHALLGALARVDLRNAAIPKRVARVQDTGTITQWPAETKIGPRILAENVPGLSSRCMVVQIARRTETGRGAKARVRLELDRTLYGLLGLSRWEDQILNRAALQLHEAVYLLGSETGQTTSSETRRLTAILLSNDKFESFARYEQNFLDQNDSDALYQRRNLMRHELMQDGFGDVVIPNQRANPRMAEAYKSYHAKDYAMLQSQIAGDEAGNTQKRIAYFSGLSAEEGFFLFAEINVQNGLVSDIAPLIDPRSPLHAKETKLVCSRVRPDLMATASGTELLTASSIIALATRVAALCRHLR